MTDLEYASYIMEIVQSGRGYEAIKDISDMLYQESLVLKNRTDKINLRFGFGIMKEKA